MAQLNHDIVIQMVKNNKFHRFVDNVTYCYFGGDQFLYSLHHHDHGGYDGPFEIHPLVLAAILVDEEEK